MMEFYWTFDMDPEVNVPVTSETGISIRLPPLLHCISVSFASSPLLEFYFEVLSQSSGADRMINDLDICPFNVAPVQR